MATFRQEQIEEILNYDRSMNRIILDNEINQATRFNDERNPPTNRDIKFEALLGTLIDGLKAKMAEALTSIAAQQYPKADSTTVSTLLGLPTGEKFGRFRGRNVQDIKKAQKLQEDALWNAAEKQRAESQKAKLEDEEEHVGEDEEDGNAPTGEHRVPNVHALTEKAPNPGAASFDLNSIQGFGKRHPKVRQFELTGMYGGDNTASGLATEKSHTTHTNATENILYDIVNQYNGIIDKLLQATQPDGRYATKRSATSSNVSYFADVLKGLLEPLKHLVFELTQVRNPQLASVLNMVTSMVDLIDVSPPFQKVNVVSYKTGMPDFQGLTGETTLLNADGYLADIKLYKKKIEHMFNQVSHQITSVLFNYKDKRTKDSIMAALKERKDRLAQIIKDIDAEETEVEERQRLTGEFQANADLINRAETLYEELETFLTSGPTSRAAKEVAEFYNPDEVSVLLGPQESLDEYHIRLKEFEHALGKQINEIQEYMYSEQIEEGADEELDDKLNKLIKAHGRIQDDITRVEGILQDESLYAGPDSLIGHGGSGGLADLLASRKIQYWNHRQTDIYDFDKQYKELIKSNQNWQSKSNPPHTTPVGSLFPFYKKDKASLYSFPLKLKSELAKVKPDDTQKDARGADVSLLQGPIGAVPLPEKKPEKKKPTMTHRTKEEANKEILEGSGKKNPKALHKLTFDDEDNEMFEDEEYVPPKDGGMVPEEEPEQPDRFRNKKLGPVKKKSVKK